MPSLGYPIIPVIQNHGRDEMPNPCVLVGSKIEIS